ncbi:hypothetical protein OH76DRAFT_217461 [Lentinus brumalis]|uniref:Uncharacterized protein n=1 Tax=Lentinus brumalis TaxID=2498619 RepID=A0A371CMB0_9APHY|nr:hypothetical protein OH76DRAFT_217461 [Polyporus brumalis]
MLSALGSALDSAMGKNNNNTKKPSNNDNGNKNNRDGSKQQQPSPWPLNAKAKDAEKAKERAQAVNGTPLPSPPESPKKETPPLAATLVNDTKGQKPSRLDTTSAGPGSSGANPNGTPSTAAATVGPSGSGNGRDPAAAAAVVGLVGAMKDTLGAVGQTLDALASQSARVAELGPAIDAMQQVQALRGEVERQQREQEDRMQQEKERLQEQLKGHIREHLRPLANQIVADVVQREVVGRVSQKLTERIPSSLRDEVNEYKLKILQAKARLHNSEARRHNALIRASGLEEPLQALLRPLDIPATSNAQMPTPPATASSTMSAASLRAQVGATGRDSTRLSVNTDLRSPCNTASPGPAVGAPTTTPGGMRSRSALVPPTPSPLFPTNLSTLVSLGPDEVKALVREYGLVSEGDGDDGPRASMAAGGGGRGGASPRPVSHITNVSDAGQSWIEAGLDGTREDDLNKFMRYVWVSMGAAFVLCAVFLSHSLALASDARF